MVEGVPLQFVDRSPNKSFQGNRVHGAREKQFVTLEIQRLCQQGFLERVRTHPHCVLPLQTAPKKSGGFWVDTDCRYVNNFLHIPKFSQRGIRDVLDQIEVADRLQTIDLKDGFFHLSI